MKLKLIAVLALFLMPVSAFAANVAPHWQIDPAQSTLTFSGTQQGAGFDGKFTDFSGDIVFDPANPAGGHATIKVTMASATTNSPDRDQYIGQDAWFAVGKFPLATYDITSFEKTSNGQYVAHGALTVRDRTLPLNLPFTLAVDPSGKAIADGQALVNRLDFGIGQGEWKDTSMVGNAITVKVHLVASRK
jgi:polyisoprenoid-binding protein YceI